MSKSKHPKSSTTSCPSCGGRGSYQAPSLNFSVMTLPCGACKGTGRVAHITSSPNVDKTTPKTDLARQLLIDGGVDPFKK